MKHILILCLCAASLLGDDQWIAGLSVNGGAKAVAASGWPWVVSVAAFDASGVEVPLPPEAVVEVAGTGVTLQRHARLPIWTLPPGREWSEGTYRVELRVAQRQWSAQVDVVKETSAGARELAFSWWFDVQGEPEQALREVDAWIGKEPRAIAARIRQAEILEELGRVPEALAALEEAVRLHRGSPAAKFRPVGIRRFQERLLSGGGNQ